MKKSLKKSIGIVLAALVAVGGLLAGGSFYMLSYALRPDAVMAEKNASSYEYMYAEYPFLAEWADSLRSSGALRDTVIVGDGGERLHAVYAAAPEPTDRTAVIVHGYTDNAVRMLMIGYLYNHDLGCNILLPDLHYHGESEGRAIRMGWKDRLDVLRWMDVANGLFGGRTRMVVHGISMGAATTMMVSGEPQRPYVKCFVEDCGYTSVWDEFRKELREQFSLPAFPLLYTASWLCDLKYGWSFREASALRQVAKCELPMLFIHGDADDFVPTRMVYPLYEAKPGEKELWVVPGAAHAMSYRDNRAEYTRRVAEFVGRYVGDGPCERIDRTRHGIGKEKRAGCGRTAAGAGVLPDAGGGRGEPSGRRACGPLPAVCRGVRERIRAGGAAMAVPGVRRRPRPAVRPVRSFGVFLRGRRGAGPGLRNGLPALPVSAGRGGIRGDAGALRMLPPEHSVRPAGVVAREAGARRTTASRPEAVRVGVRSGGDEKNGGVSLRFSFGVRGSLPGCGCLTRPCRPSREPP